MMNFAGARGPDDSQRCARFCAKNDEFGTEYDRFVLKMMIFYRKIMIFYRKMADFMTEFTSNFRMDFVLKMLIS